MASYSPNWKAISVHVLAMTATRLTFSRGTDTLNLFLFKHPISFLGGFVLAFFCLSSYNKHL